MPGKCVFNPGWLDKECYKIWLASVPDQNRAYCKLCYKEFDIGRMGESALKSHMKGLKHMERYKNKIQSHELVDLLEVRNKPLPAHHKLQTNSQSLMSSFVSKDSVIDAEIRWALKCMKSHYSYNSCEGINNCFIKMFPDSDIAKQFSCGATKCSYLCCFGLGPYFKNCVLKCLDECNYYTVLFDETLNKSTQKKQMDIHVRFWDVSLAKIKTLYLTSAFIGHAKAEALLAAFYDSVDKLKLTKILQLSMDGPNVNWKFFDSLQTDLKQQYNYQTICIGSCGLHILNNAFKHGENSTGWNISSILISLYWLFKDSPARREDFINSSSNPKFPVKFCNFRWLENVPAVERAIEIWQDITSYVDNVEKGKYKTNKNKSYFNVLESTKDKLILIKFHSFLSVTKIVTPFLEFYQTDAPLVPFFADDVVKLIKHCAEHFHVLKPKHTENMSSASQLCKVDFNDKNLLNTVDKVSLGFTADKLLKQLLLKKVISDKEALMLKHNCQQFVTNMIVHLMKKCPINYILVRSSSCFDPRKMFSKPSNCEKYLKTLINYLVENNFVLDKDCDAIMLEYKNFLNNVVRNHPSSFQNYSPQKTRLDTFLNEFVSQDIESYKKIWHIMKIVMTLSHGQATVERGFSVNKQLEVENLQSESYIAQRLIADAINSHDDFLSIPITNEMRKSVSGARQKYILDLEKKQKEKILKEAGNKRKIISDELNDLKFKKKCLEKDICEMDKSCEAFAEEAEKKDDLSLFKRSNALRKTVKEKNSELNDIQHKIKIKIEEMQNCS